MNNLTALRLQIEWGADEALDESPVNRISLYASAQKQQEARAPKVSRPATLPPARQAVMAPAQRAQDVANAAKTSAELRAALEVFDGCGLSATATSLVFADGNADSGLMVVGEGPGAEEDRAGRPFVGEAGQLLDRMLGSVGLDRTKLLLTNLIPWRPPGNRNPTDAEISICLPFLLRHIALVRPRFLVLLGAISTQAVLGTKGGIARQRGKWMEAKIPGLSEGIPALPMLHPAYLTNNAGAKAQAWSDFISLRRRLDSNLK